MQSRQSTFQMSKEAVDEATLVDQLNSLLASLHLPISLISPTDLTPSLLIAILESLLGTRIPMIERETDAGYSSKTSKLQNMKIFLGVLEMDILKMDVGLSDIDPRKLADGDDEEVLYVAEVLCGISKSKKNHFMRKPARQDQRLVTTRPKLPEASTPQTSIRPLSPKSQLDLDAESLFQTGSTMTGSTRQWYPGLFSPFFNGDEESMTSLFSDNHHEQSEAEDGYSDGVSDILSALPPFTSPNAIPHCIHEVSTPSLLLSVDPGANSSRQVDNSEGRFDTPIPRSQAFSDYDVSNDTIRPVEHSYLVDQSRSSVRYTGFIEPVDEDFELASFENSRSTSFANMSSAQKGKPSVKIESVKRQYTRTLELLNERTRLLTQLSEIKKKSHG